MFLLILLVRPLSVYVSSKVISYRSPFHDSSSVPHDTLVSDDTLVRVRERRIPLLRTSSTKNSAYYVLTSPSYIPTLNDRVFMLVCTKFASRYSSNHNNPLSSVRHHLLPWRLLLSLVYSFPGLYRTRSWTRIGSTVTFRLFPKIRPRSNLSMCKIFRVTAVTRLTYLPHTISLNKNREIRTWTWVSVCVLSIIDLYIRIVDLYIQLVVNSYVSNYLSYKINRRYS